MTMQPDELKAIRKSLDMTQQQFADALGLSKQFISMMERGDKPISKVTELAARYLCPYEIVPRMLKSGERFVLVERRYSGLSAPSSKHDLSVHDTMEDARAALKARWCAGEAASEQ